MEFKQLMRIILVLVLVGFLLYVFKDQGSTLFSNIFGIIEQQGPPNELVVEAKTGRFGWEEIDKKFAFYEENEMTIRLKVLNPQNLEKCNVTFEKANGTVDDIAFIECDMRCEDLKISSIMGEKLAEYKYINVWCENFKKEIVSEKLITLKVIGS